MLNKLILYALFFYSINNYIEFFTWYLGDGSKFTHDALQLSIASFLPMFLFIFLTHFLYYPKRNDDHALVISFPPLILLFSINFGFLISTLNLYHFQLYDLPDFFNILRSTKIGILFIIIALIIFILSINEFNKVNEDPVPTSSSKLIIQNGIYRYTRNPMYLAMLILQLGIGMSLSMIHIILLMPLTFIILNYYVILPEEKYLESKFQNRYLKYMNSVRRWI